MKICTLCKEAKPLSDFNKKKGSKDGLQPQCRVCSKKWFKKYYEDNKEKHKAVVVQNKAAYMARNAELLLETKRLNGCCLCEEQEPCCLDFHHLNPDEKKFTIAEAKSGLKTAWTTIATELSKCVCLCANCHRKVHAGLVQVNNTQVCKLPESC